MILRVSVRVHKRDCVYIGGSTPVSPAPTGAKPIRTSIRHIPQTVNCEHTHTLKLAHSHTHIDTHKHAQTHFG